MTREQQIQLALAILEPDHREKCHADIVQWLAVVDEVTTEETAPALLASKTTKTQVQAYRDTLHRAQVKHRVLPEPIKAEFGDLDLQKHLEACDLILKQPSKPLQNLAVRQRFAAGAAQALLFDYGVWPVVTRSGSWDRLAAVLFGDRATNMVPYLRPLKELNDIW